MKNGLVISDSGPIFSLAMVNKLEVLEELFVEIFIPNAVWDEITKDQNSQYYQRIVVYFQHRVKSISGLNRLTFVMDYGESEAVILHGELNADFLLIDDKKARDIAEGFGIKCIGTIGILSIAREKGIIDELRPIFKTFLSNKRFYNIKILNALLRRHNEDEI